MFTALHVLEAKKRAKDALMATGKYTRLQARRAAALVDTNKLVQAAKNASVALPAAVVGTLGDGHILKEIIAWFESPTGQAVIAALVKLLLLALGL